MFGKLTLKRQPCVIAGARTAIRGFYLFTHHLIPSLGGGDQIEALKPILSLAANCWVVTTKQTRCEIIHAPNIAMGEKHSTALLHAVRTSLS